MKKALYTQVDFGFTCDALSHFYLIYQQMEQYLKKQTDLDIRNFYMELISVFWEMQSSAEQILLFIANKEVMEENKRILEHDICILDYVLQTAESRMRSERQRQEEGFEFRPFRMELEGESYLSLVLRKYSRTISTIYRMSLKEKRGR